jgi:hypothetical protein
MGICIGIGWGKARHHFFDWKKIARKKNKMK